MPDGRLMVRVASDLASETEWGPYQEQLWAAVRAVVDPHGGAQQLGLIDRAHHLATGA